MTNISKTAHSLQKDLHYTTNISYTPLIQPILPPDINTYSERLIAEYFYNARQLKTTEQSLRLSQYRRHGKQAKNIFNQKQLPLKRFRRLGQPKHLMIPLIKQLYPHPFLSKIQHFIQEVNMLSEDDQRMYYLFKIKFLNIQPDTPFPIIVQTFQHFTRNLRTTLTNHHLKSMSTNLPGHFQWVLTNIHSLRSLHRAARFAGNPLFDHVKSPQMYYNDCTLTLHLHLDGCSEGSANYISLIPFLTTTLSVSLPLLLKFSLLNQLEHNTFGPSVYTTLQFHTTEHSQKVYHPVPIKYFAWHEETLKQPYLLQDTIILQIEIINGTDVSHLTDLAQQHDWSPTTTIAPQPIPSDTTV